jgi:hypothetical protein
MDEKKMTSRDFSGRWAVNQARESGPVRRACTLGCLTLKHVNELLAWRKTKKSISSLQRYLLRL